MGHAKSRLIFGRKQSYADVEESNPVDLKCRFLFIKLWNNIKVYYAMPSKLPQLLIEWKITLFKKESIEKCSNTNKKLWECQISIWTTTFGKCNNQMNKYRLNWPSAVVCQHFHLLGNYKFARFHFRFFYFVTKLNLKKKLLPLGNYFTLNSDNRTDGRYCFLDMQFHELLSFFAYIMNITSFLLAAIFDLNLANKHYLQLVDWTLCFYGKCWHCKWHKR